MKTPEELMQDLVKDYTAFKKSMRKELDAQLTLNRKLEKQVKELEEEQDKLLKYVNNLMRKADGVIKKNYAELRRSQVIDRQRMNTLDNEVSNLSRRIKPHN